MFITIICCIALLFSLFPALLYCQNISRYRPPMATTVDVPAVSVLIPARNEEAVIETVVRSALESEGVTIEVLVLDDHSEDSTAEIVRQIALSDARVRLIQAPPLPTGWNGKQHACYVLSQHAKNSYLVFVDADVTLTSDGLRRMICFIQSTNADLVSGIPKQITITWLEKLLIPLIHFLLLGFLPISRMRQSRMPSLGAGCGQLFLAKKASYHQCGGHSVIKQTMHDGIKLPRAFRQAGLMTDLFDATNVATCRMYHSAQQVWFGLAKNAREGLASNQLIIPFTVMLFCGQILPFVCLFLIDWTSLLQTMITCVAIFCSIAVRMDSAIRFKQSMISAILNPLGILCLLCIQWFALFRDMFGVKPTWKGRKAEASLTNDQST